MLHYLAVIKFFFFSHCIWIQARLYNLKKHLCKASQAPPSPVATSVLTEINMPLNGALAKKKKKRSLNAWISSQQNRPSQTEMHLQSDEILSLFWLRTRPHLSCLLWVGWDFDEVRFFLIHSRFACLPHFWFTAEKLFRKKKGSPVSYELAWAHPAMCSISACLQWRDRDGHSTFPTSSVCIIENWLSVLKYLSIMAWQKCGEFTPPQYSVAWMSYPTGSILRNLIGKHHL